MSTISAYFIPTKKYVVGEFKEKVKNALKKLKIIDGYYDKDAETFAHGKAMVFEYASIHDSNENKLIPAASSSGYGATCTQCSADIDEEFYDTINEYYDYEGESGTEKDMTRLVLTCLNTELLQRHSPADVSFPAGFSQHNLSTIILFP